MRVLLIDDEPETQAILNSVLSPLIKDGTIELRYAQTVDRGFKAIVEWQPDIALLDLSFPESCAEATIKSVIPPMSRATGVIVMTGHADEIGYWDSCLNAGALNYLQKDYYFDPDYRKALYHAIRNTAGVNRALKRSRMQ